jgi:hypothetical protein
MKFHRAIIRVLAVAITLSAGERAFAQAERSVVELVISADTPLRVALDERVRLKGVGQRVTGTLAEAIYAYDRIVAPAGAKVWGRVARLEKVPGGVRFRAMLGGDFTPLRRAVLEFDTLVLDDCREMPIRTEVRSTAERLVLKVKDRPEKSGIAARAADEIAQEARQRLSEARQAISAVKAPGKMRRLKDALVRGLPYHPQYLRAGTVYTAVLLSPLSFGTVEGAEWAPPGTAPPPESVLHARLLTPLDSSGTPRGTAVRAVVTEPVFSDDNRLILPEGTVLAGEVTFAKPAARFHRNGQLRFLFETVQVPEESPGNLRASLYSVQVASNERLAVDEEGGTTITNSKKRFVAPALAGLAFALTMHRHLENDADGGGPEAAYGSGGSEGVGGFFGLGLLGAGLSQLSRPVAVGLGVLGLARTAFTSVVGRGRDVSFPADTRIEVQLAPGPEPAK